MEINKLIEVINEEDSSCTVEYIPLNLVANEDSYEEAIRDIIYQAKDYAADYRNNVKLYSADNNRKNHLSLLSLITKEDSDEDVKGILGI